MAALGADNGGARLNVVDISLNAGDADPIAGLEWLLHQNQNAREEILQDVLKGEANGDAADPQDLDQVAGLKRWRDHRQPNQESKDHDA